MEDAVFTEEEIMDALSYVGQPGYFGSYVSLSDEELAESIRDTVSARFNFEAFAVVKEGNCYTCYPNVATTTSIRITCNPTVSPTSDLRWVLEVESVCTNGRSLSECTKKFSNACMGMLSVLKA